MHETASDITNFNLIPEVPGEYLLSNFGLMYFIVLPGPWQLSGVWSSILHEENNILRNRTMRKKITSIFSLENQLTKIVNYSLTLEFLYLLSIGQKCLGI